MRSQDVILLLAVGFIALVISGLIFGPVDRRPPPLEIGVEQPVRLDHDTH
jgi:hypothetical protein